MSVAQIEITFLYGALAVACLMAVIIEVLT